MESLLADLLGNPWVYVLIGGSIAGSAVFPPLPSDSLLVAAAGFAVGGRLSLVGVCCAAGLGGWFGDLLAYGAGRLARGPARRATGPGGAVHEVLSWLRGRGAAWLPGLIVGGRFVPGGTTAVGLASGVTGYPPVAYAALAAVGAAAWTAYGLAVATLAGAVTTGPWVGLLLGVVLALGAGAVVHAVVRVRGRRRGERSW